MSPSPLTPLEPPLRKIRTDERMQPPVYRSPTHAAPFHNRAGRGA